MPRAKLSLLLCWGLLACSGRYVAGRNDGVETGAGAESARGMGMGEAGTLASGGTTSMVVPTGVAGAPPREVPEMCGVPLAAPPALETPITNTMLWWFRLSKLIWNDGTHPAPPSLTASISYEQAGQLADDAIDQAIAETQGIPGAAAFVRDWLQVDPQASLLVDWQTMLSQGPAIPTLLGLQFDTTRVSAFTEPAFLLAEPSISGRGTVMVSALFNVQVPREPPGTTPFVPPPGLTRREALAEAVSNVSCASCHHFFDPLGWSLENYDASGQFATVDAGKPIDTSGSYQVPLMATTIDFKSIADLSQQLSDSCDVKLALPRRFLDFALRLTVTPGYIPKDDTDNTRLPQAFMYEGQTYRSLLKAFAQSNAIRAQ